MQVFRTIACNTTQFTSFKSSRIMLSFVLFSMNAKMIHYTRKQNLLPRTPIKTQKIVIYRLSKIKFLSGQNAKEIWWTGVMYNKTFAV